MEAILGGFGLSSAAGLNAYIPLLILALAGRFGHAELNWPYAALSSNVGLGVVIALLAVEVFADKVPGVDHVNDVVNTLMRPAAGAVLFLSSTGAGSLDPKLAAILGLLTAGTVHATKATARPLIMATTGGLGNPVVSIIEDIVSILTAVLAIFAPLLVVLMLILFVVAFVLLFRRLRARRGPRAPRRTLTRA